MYVHLILGYIVRRLVIIMNSHALNKIKLWLEFCHERGIYKYDESMINVRLMYDVIME